LLAQGQQGLFTGRSGNDIEPARLKHLSDQLA
jgi:hypothetical protein